MKKSIALTWFLSLLPVLAFATPPNNLEIAYDFEKTTLHISANHPTDRQSRHYIRTIKIYLNDASVKNIGFSRQQMPSGIAEDISVDAQEGDKIGVTLICSQGGSAKAETIVAGKAPESPKEGTE